MAYSMTGFAQAQAQQAWGEMVWELRSVNSRYLDVFFKIPKEFRSLESTCRSRIGEKIARGKLDCTLHFRQLESGQTPVQTEDDRLNQVIDLFNQTRLKALKTDPNLSLQINLLDILNWPGVVKIPVCSVDTQEIMRLFEQALEQLIIMRADEGRHLTAHLKKTLYSHRPNHCIHPIPTTDTH